MYRKLILAAFMSIVIFSPLQTVNAQTAEERYCPDGKIFNDRVAMEGNSPWIDVIVDPSWKQAELVDKRHITGDIPLTPIYDLVVRIKPIFNTYCIGGREVEAKDLPESIPIKGSILIGTGASAIEIVTGSFLPNKVKDPERGFVYEWKIKGWPGGIVSGEKLEKLIVSIAKGETVTTALDITKKDDTKERLTSSASFDLCAPIFGSGKHKIVTMRGTGAELSVMAEVGKADNETREKGFEKIEPLKTYKEHFAHFVDIKRFVGDEELLEKLEKKSTSEPRVRNLYKNIPSKSSCGGDGKVYLIYVGDQFSAGKLENVQGLAAIDSPVVILADNSSTEVIIHEAGGHTIGKLSDEYAQGGAVYEGVLDTTRNCATEPEKNYTFNGKIYGEKNIQGCSVEFLAKRPAKVGAPILGRRVYRPSLASIMNVELWSPEFNAIGCGHIIAGILGGDGKSYFPECATMEGIVGVSKEIALFSPIGKLISRTQNSLPSQTLTAQALDALSTNERKDDDLEYLIAENFDRQNPKGEIIEIESDVPEEPPTPETETPEPKPGWWERAIGSVGDFLGMIWDGTKWVVSSVWNGVTGFVSDTWRGIANLFKSEETDTAPTLAQNPPPEGRAASSAGVTDNSALVNSLNERIIKLVNERKDATLSATGQNPVDPELTTTIAQRKEKMLELAKTNPEMFLALVMPTETRKLVPQSLQKDVEQETSLTGTLEVLYEDDFEHPENSRLFYFLTFPSGNDSSGKIALKSTIPKTERVEFYPTSKFSAVSGTVISFKKAYRLLNTAVAQTSADNMEIISTPKLESVGEQKTLVLLALFEESPEPPVSLSRENLQKVIFDGPFQAFYKEQSYDKTYFTGDVYGWFRLNRSQKLGDRCDEFDPTEHPEDVALFDQLLNENNIQLGQYNRLVIVSYFNNFYASGQCTKGRTSNSTMGKMNVTHNGRSYSLSVANINEGGEIEDPFTVITNLEPKISMFETTLIHEIGHSLGLGHASGLDCGEQSVGKNCQYVEYGNIFDIMGDNNAGLHFNAPFKELLGWLSGENVLEVKTSGTYSLKPLGEKERLRAIKVKLADGNYYFLEYRNGAGFDAPFKRQSQSKNWNGLIVNKIEKNRLPWAFLLDMMPTERGWWEDTNDSTLVGNTRFEDHENGVTVGPVLSVSDTEITFQIAISGNRADCIRSLPKLEISDRGREITSTVGVPNTLSLRIINDDTIECASRTLGINTLSYSGWFFSLPNATAVPPQSTKTVEIRFSVPPSTVPGGRFPFTFILADENGREIGQPQSITIIATPPPPPPPPSNLNLSVTKPTLWGQVAPKVNTMYAGEITLRVTIKNEGEAIEKIFSNTIQVKLPESNTWWDWITFDIARLEKGGEAKVSHSWTVSPGEWDFRVVANSKKEIKEQGIFSEPVRISVIKKEDAVIPPPPPKGGTPKLVPETPVISGTEAGVGKIAAGPMDIYEKVTNTGDGVAPPFEILLLYSQDGENWNDWVRLSVSELNPQAEQTLWYAWKGNAGKWHFKACEDVKDTCSEPVFIEIVPS